MTSNSPQVRKVEILLAFHFMLRFPSFNREFAEQTLSANREFAEQTLSANREFAEQTLSANREFAEQTLPANREFALQTLTDIVADLISVRLPECSAGNWQVVVELSFIIAYIARTGYLFQPGSSGRERQSHASDGEYFESDGFKSDVLS